MDKKNYGLNDLMVTAAHRYCLGRATYIVDECIEWLKEIWAELEPSTRKRTQEETWDAIVRDCAGHEEDKENWKQFYEWSKGDGSK